MHKILIPTDFSENAMMAVDFAIDQLMNEDSELYLINIYQVPHGGNSGFFYLLDELQKQAKNGMEEFKIEVVNRHPEKSLKIDSEVAQGNFSDQCNAIAKKIDADCIVMGTKGASGVKEVLIGSNTADLMNNLEVPLYVVPKDFKDKSIKEMILSYDGSGISIKVAPPILKFAKKHQLPLELLHVRVEEDSPIQDWSDAKSLFEGIKVDLHESWGKSYEEGLKRGIENREAILVMIKRKKSFWERFFNISDTRKVVMHAELPILVIPE